jgi:hypothetical protein
VLASHVVLFDREPSWCDSSVLRLITNVSASSDVLNFGMTRFSKIAVARASEAVNVRDFGFATPEAKTRCKHRLFLPWFPLSE